MTTSKAKPAACIAAFAACLLSTLSVRADPVIKPAGIRVVTEQHGESSSGLRPFNAPKLGVTAGLLVVVEEELSIVAIPRDLQKLKSFTDDKGKNLLEVPEGFRRDGFGPFPKISKDGKAALVEVSVSGLPSPGATTVKLAGRVTIHTGSNVKPVKSAVFTPEADAKVTAPGFNFTVKKAGKPEYGDAPLAMTLTIDRDVPEIAAFRFFDAEGHRIKHVGAGSSRTAFGDKVVSEHSFSFDKAHPKLIMEVDAWTDMRIQALPFDLTIGLAAR